MEQSGSNDFITKFFHRWTMDDAVEIEQPTDAQWEKLPPLALQNIFRLLSQTDRTRAASVCKTWKTASNAPSLWTAPFVRCARKRNDKVVRSAQKMMVKKYGAFFRKLTIAYSCREINSTKFIVRQMNELLKTMRLKKVQLETLQLQRMKILTRIPKGSRFEELTKFLNRQTRLSVVDFKHAKHRRSYEGVRILECLPADKVEDLRLQHFFDSHTFRLTQTYTKAIAKFSNLKSLSLNYYTISNSVMERLASGLSGQFETFSILYDCRERNSIISDEKWLLLRESCPRMRVMFKTVKFSVCYMMDNLRSVLTPSIPLDNVSITSYFSRPAIVAVANHLTVNFSQSLRRVEFDVRSYGEMGIADGLNGIMASCINLSHLTLIYYDLGGVNITHMLDGVLNGILAREQRPISLIEFRVHFKYLSYRYKCMLSQYRRQYREQFGNVGVVFKIRGTKGTPGDDYTRRFPPF